ncbi:uncharacterized protein LOC133182112 [Saccostrea echinata]|uniref:uncharacterized protein LOC133182112 n=1 Tax=Saccostrea echinata TaxID=191078 RepID=UPI002A812BBD|nr:uncharacterized protein LOC133182112 [Saccostrea echinata]
MYRFMTDSSEPNSTEVDMLWLSQKDYNYINADFMAIYTPPDITSQPEYVEEFKFGIVGGWLQLDLTKVARNSSSKAFVSLNSTTYPCPNQPGSLNPNTSVYTCNVTHFNFDRLLEDGDNLTLTVIAQSGGYRKLKTSSTTSFKDPFMGSNSSKSMMYRFDFRKPYHCILDTIHVCSSKAFTVNEDITKNPIQFSWDGWADVLSGIGKYTIQEFLLQPNQNVNPNLTEPDPWSPTKTITFDKSERTFAYTPKQPGMYSYILNIVDRANNSEYARTLVLFDNTSSITKDDAFPMISTSAVEETNFQWQNNLKNDISISWKGHFRNVLHEDKKLLIPVTDYKHYDHDKKFQKRVLPKLDDNDGNRTLKPISNIHGIIKFEYDFGNANQGSQEPVSWRPINDLTETVTFNIPRRDGDTLNVWIKATDVMGNQKYDLMHVYFDETPPSPLIHNDVLFIPNLKNSTFSFTSRLLVNTQDKNSGIHKIDWTFSSNQTGDLFKSGSMPGNKTNTTLRFTEGYQIPMGDNFYYSHYLDIDNCWMVVPKESFRNESIKLNLIVYNRAMESTTFMKMISNLESLDGIDEYSGPTNLHIEKTYDNGVRLRWTVTPSCYERTRILVLVVSKDGKTYTRLVDKDADYFDLTGLDAETVYNLSFVTAYAAQKSDPVYLSFKTTESPAALTAGGIAGISIVMILLLGIIVVGVIMWRTGRLTVAKQNIQRRVTVVRERIQNRFSASHFNMSYEDQDDIYLYGGKEISTSDDYIIPHSSVILETLLTSGRFADIYKIRYHPQNSTSRGDKYVAKVLKNGYTEEQEISMRAKINFYATKVGEHSNILRFYGAVFDDMALGPYMVLEYCELGQLNTWLQEQKSRANEETSEQLCRIVYGISKGMLHFENRKLVHRRLAARNVLLTSELEPKLYGFCPQQQTSKDDHKDDDGDVKDDKERIPIKWAAPECLVSMKYATPKSDVWSFGVVLWEIFSFGDVPYPGVRSRDVQMHLRNGNRMSRPEFANDFYYNLMKQCWQRKAKQRPSFNDITAEIGKTFNTVPSDDFYYYSQKQ